MEQQPWGEVWRARDEYKNESKRVAPTHCCCCCCAAKNERTATTFLPSFLPSFLPPSLVGSSPLRRCSSMAADHAPGRRKRRLEDTVTAPIPEPSTCLPNERQRSSRVVAVVDRAPTAPSFAPADQGAPAHSRPAEMLADLEREAQVLRQLHQQFNEQLNRLQVRARP